MNNYKYFVKSTAWIVRFILFGILLFLISRLAYLFTYGDFKELSNFKIDLVRAFWVGIRFDVKVLTFAFLPVMLIPIATIFLGSKLFKTFKQIIKTYGIIVICVFALLMVIDYYFYSFYNTRISIIIFGFFEDDTLAVIKTLWTDFPLILILIGLSIVLFLIIKVSQRIVKEREHVNFLSSKILIQIITIILVIGFYFLGLRGTVAIVPLDGRHATISENTFINTLTNNGVFSLKTAYSDKKKYKIDIDIPKMLKRYKFESEKDAIAKYLNSQNSDTIDIYDLMETTPKNEYLEKNPPSVVFVMMESMSNYYMQLHSVKTNLLGTLENALNYCYVYKKFLPSYNLTIYSLENLMVGTPQGPLSQSKYQTVTLESSVAKPFSDKGYATTFITGGKMGWRSMDKFIGKQYFDKIEAEPNLLKEYPNANVGEWGVHDEHLFERVYEILNNSEGKPQFIYAMTISHHTPYDIPKTYNPYPIELTDEMKSKLKTSSDVALKNLTAFQYANDCLGQFIEKLKKSPSGKNTIVVITGDHNILQTFEFSDKDLLMKYSVPLIIYIPDAYKPKNTANTNIFASHKDIFPTIFNISLSNSKYLKTGNNLFASDLKNSYGLYCYKVAMDSIGCVDFTTNTPLFFRWNETRNQLEPSKENPDKYLQDLMLKSKAYVASMNLFIMNDLANKTKNEVEKK